MMSLDDSLTPEPRRTGMNLPLFHILRAMTAARGSGS